jgi:peptidoglycan/LPS O-acetylase OafA/YrhL
MVSALLVLILISWLTRQVLYYGFGVGQSYLYHAFETRMDQLAIGCLLAVALRRRMFYAVWRLACASPLAPALVIAALAVSSLFHGSDPYRFTVGYTIEPILTAVLLVQLVVFSGNRVWALFNSGPMLFLGRISYSLYLYQQITLYTARRLSAEYPVAVQFVFALACTIVAAWASYAFVEKRFRSPGAS